MDKIVNLSLARKSVPILIDVVQGATAPNIVFVLEDYTPPSNARARLYIKKTNAEVYNDCVLSGNQITYTPTAGSFDEAGQCVAQLEIVQGNTIAVSWRIFVTVEPNLIEGSAAPASTEYGALESLIINAQQYDTIIGANNIVGANARQGWTNLTTGQDLNSVTSVGIYYANSAGIYNSVLNSPMTGKPFRLDVQYSIANNSYLRQIWTANTGEQFIRESINIGSTWSEWRLTPTRAEVNAIAKALNQYTFVKKNASNMDFYNNYSASMPNNTYYRDFVANSSAAVMSGVNVMLEGVKTTNDYEWQRVTAYFTGLMMIRRKRAGTWEEWKTVVN